MYEGIAKGLAQKLDTRLLGNNVKNASLNVKNAPWREAIA